MSTIPDLGLDLEHLFQPAWAQGKTEENRFDKFTGDEGVTPERRRGERRGPRREGGEGERGGERPRRPGKFGERKGGPSRRGDRREHEREREDREPLAPLPEIGVVFLSDENGVESLARQIRMTGRAYPLFDIARLILQKPERYAVRLHVKKNAEGAVVQPLFVCALDDTPWLSEEEVVAHVLGKHFATFYQTERTPTEPPKGKYTFVAQCGMSGVILGPPNYHDYQNQLRKLHAERFSRMPFDVFKSRVKIVKDEAVVKQWVEEQSFTTQYVCLNVPEPLKLPNREEVEKHFRATHKDAIVKSVESHTVGGVLSRNLRSSGLYRAVRAEWEQQRRFPLQLSTDLSKQFAGHGLQFFKVNKTVVHVSVARPQYLDLETTPVSENVRRIVSYINTHNRCTHRQLIEALAPSPAIFEVKPEAPSPAGEPAPKAATATAEPTPEQTAISADLHWLIHQGHVLEFADGRMETAKKPLPRPPKPEKKPADAAPAAGGESAPATEVVPATEITPSTEAAAEPAAEAPIASEPAVVVQPPAGPIAEPASDADKSVAEVAAPAETAEPVKESPRSN